MVVAAHNGQKAIDAVRAQPVDLVVLDVNMPGLNGIDACRVIKTITNPLRGWFFCLAFVSIGLESNFADMAKQMEGGKPLLLYVVGQSFNLILTLAMAWLAISILFPDVI